MEQQKNRSLLRYIFFPTLVFIILGASLIYAFKEINTLNYKVDTLTDELTTTKQKLSSSTDELTKNVKDLHKETSGLSTTLTDTQQNITAVKSEVGGVAQTVGSISGTVNTLQKLSQVDPQLLKKYSKVYFMNENYTPAHLTQLPEEYNYSTIRQEQFLAESWPYLKDLLDAAKRDNVKLFVKSGYRSFAEQKTLKSTYTILYGAGTANAFSADQGYSEHQLGTTIDFISLGQGGQLEGFDKTEGYAWLIANAYRYGFVISYPKGNKYYVYEAWHWRYVGVKLATYLHDTNRNFYDLDQREIDKYLVNLFD